VVDQVDVVDAVAWGVVVQVVPDGLVECAGDEPGVGEVDGGVEQADEVRVGAQEAVDSGWLAWGRACVEWRKGR
jgi:hypothetical protein